MKNVCLLFIMLGFSQMRSQCIFVYASEKFKGAEIPITRTEFKVYVNDTLKKTNVSQNDGSVGRVPLEKGTYKVKVTGEGFVDAIQEGVIVNESRTTNLIVNLVRVGASSEEDKKKNEKK